MITEEELRQEIQEVEDLLSDYKEEFLHESDYDCKEYLRSKIISYTHYLKAFKMVLNGFEFETGSY